MEQVTRRPTPRPLSGAIFSPLPGQAKEIPTQGPVIKSIATTGEQDAFSGLQLSHASDGAAYAVVMTGRIVKQPLLGWV